MWGGGGIWSQFLAAYRAQSRWDASPLRVTQKKAVYRLNLTYNCMSRINVIQTCEYTDQDLNTSGVKLLTEPLYCPRDNQVMQKAFKLKMEQGRKKP